MGIYSGRVVLLLLPLGAGRSVSFAGESLLLLRVLLDRLFLFDLLLCEVHERVLVSLLRILGCCLLRSKM